MPEHAGACFPAARRAAAAEWDADPVDFIAAGIDLASNRHSRIAVSRKIAKAAADYPPEVVGPRAIFTRDRGVFAPSNGERFLPLKPEAVSEGLCPSARAQCHATGIMNVPSLALRASVSRAGRSRRVLY